MLNLLVTIQTLLWTGGDRIRRPRDERGSLTMEQALWAAFVIVIVGSVVAIFKAFIQRHAASIK